MKRHLKQTMLHKILALYKKLTPFSSKFLAFFEPFTPFFATLFLRRKLEELRKNNTINNYYLDIKRISKFHYAVEFKFIVTSKQISSIIMNAFDDLMRRLHNE